MTMEDWKDKLDAFLRFNDAEVLQALFKKPQKSPPIIGIDFCGNVVFHKLDIIPSGQPPALPLPQFLPGTARIWKVNQTHVLNARTRH